MRWGLATFAAVGALVVFGYLGLVWTAQRSVLYPRPPVPPGDATAGVAGLELIRLGGEFTTEAWYLPATADRDAGPALIFAHGNGELIDFWAAAFDPMRAAGFAVLLVEYPGYGRSQGTPSQASITATFVAAYDQLVEREEIRAEAVIGYGRSLGGGAICQLAARRPLAALVLESTFTGVAPLARGMGVPRRLVRDPFDNLAVVRSYAGPLLILHGERDGIIPFAHARALHDAAPNSVLAAMPCGHNDCPRPWPAMLEFLAGVEPVAAAAAGIES